MSIFFLAFLRDIWQPSDSDPTRREMKFKVVVVIVLGFLSHSFSTLSHTHTFTVLHPLAIRWPPRKWVRVYKFIYYQLQ